MWKDFKEFAFKGNVIDLAVAVVIGAAFSGIVTSLVDNIITPVIGILLNGIHFDHLKFTVGNAQILYGAFIQSIFNFFVIAGSIFLFIRLLMRFKRVQEEKEPVKIDMKQKLLTDIRDLLKEQQGKK